MRSVWIVEANFAHDETGKYMGWHSTVGIGLNREDGRKELAHWKRSPDSPDRFRLIRYVPDCALRGEEPCKNE